MQQCCSSTSHYWMVSRLSLSHRQFEILSAVSAIVLRTTFFSIPLYPISGSIVPKFLRTSKPHFKREDPCHPSNLSALLGKISIFPVSSDGTVCSISLLLIDLHTSISTFFPAFCLHISLIVLFSSLISWPRKHIFLYDQGYYSFATFEDCLSFEEFILDFLSDLCIFWNRLGFASATLISVRVHYWRSILHDCVYHADKL